MAIGFNAIGIVKYNGVTFDGTAETKVNVEYVKDEADRTVVYQKHTITIRAIIAGNPTDPQMLAIRNQLCQQGQELIFVNHGFGSDLVVNANTPSLYQSPYTDVKWGPKPAILHWEPIGANNACEIEFQVTTCISCCTPSSTLPLLALNYGASYSIDNMGMVTRTITGYYEIAQTRNANNTIPQSADTYRAIIAPNLPVYGSATFSGSNPLQNWTWEGMGFQRSSNWSLSLDKSREDFTITDKQIPSPHAYPDYAVKVSGEHSAEMRRPRKGNGGLWKRHRISLSIVLADGINPAIGFLIFANIVNARVKAANYNSAGGVTQRVMFEGLRIRERLFEVGCDYEIEYKVLGATGETATTALTSFVNNSGLWTTLPTSWLSWATSMSTLFGNYGTARIKTLANNDNIVDSCNTPSTSVDVNMSINLPQQPTLSPIAPKNVIPDQSYSYNSFENVVMPYSDTPTSRQAILQSPVSDSAASMTGPDWNTNPAFSMADNNTTNDIIQIGGGRRQGAMMVGYAERYGYPVPRPAYMQVGTATAVPVSERYEEKIVGNVMGVPLYRLSWAIGYEFNNSPGAVQPPQNFEQGVNADGSISS